MPKIREVSVNELSELTGKNHKTIRRLLKDLIPAREDKVGTYYESTEALKHIYGVTELDRQKLRFETARAERLELALKEKNEKLIPVEVVIKEWSNICTLIKTKVLAIASKMKQRHSDLTLDHYSSLDELLREALEAIATDVEK